MREVCKTCDGTGEVSGARHPIPGEYPPGQGPCMIYYTHPCPECSGYVPEPIKMWEDPTVIAIKTFNERLDRIESAIARLSEHQSAVSQHTGGQPKAGGLQNRECLGVMDDPEMKGD